MSGYADAYKRARAMQAFYQPAYFGQPETTYTDPLGTQTFTSPAGPAPTTMGGFSYQPTLSDDELMAPYWGSGSVGDIMASRETFGAPDEFLARQQAAQSGARTAQHKALALAPPRPTYGVAQLQNYGVGALNNYGVGALDPTRRR